VRIGPRCWNANYRRHPHAEAEAHPQEPSWGCDTAWSRRRCGDATSGTWWSKGMMTDRPRTDDLQDLESDAPDWADPMGSALRKTTGSMDLAVAENPAPVFLETDELFRSIYTRAGTGFAPELIAICSAIAGEG